MSQLATVLVVEDDPELLDALKQLFSDFRVVCVQTLAEAHAVLAKTARGIDVVVVDYWLPDGNADHLLAALVGIPHAPAIVVLSSDDRAAASAERLSVEFVRKPFDGHALFDIVVRAHERRARPTR